MAPRVRRTAPVPPADPYYPSGLCSDFCWLKPIDPVKGQWEEHPIGSGPGNDAWPHGTVVAPLLPGGRLALVACYHGNATPELFEVPEDPRTCLWTKRPLTSLQHKEEIVSYDLTGDVLLYPSPPPLAFARPLFQVSPQG